MSSGESKILHKRLAEKFVLWEAESSSNVVGVENKGKKRAERTVVSDAVLNEDVNVKMSRGNSYDAKKKNFEFTPPNRVVGMYKYLVSCALEPSAFQFDPLIKLVLMLSMDWIISTIWNPLVLRIKVLHTSLSRFKISVTPSLFKMVIIMFICLGIRIYSSKSLLI